MRRAALIAAAVAALAAAPAQATTKYELQGGCYGVQGLDGANQVRFQATGLGRYLLYRPDGTFVGPDGITQTPRDWIVEDQNGGFSFSSGGSVLFAKLTPATGCATYPEAGLNATGTPAQGATPYQNVSGLIDGHMHWMTFEYFGGRFHCGKPWDPYGIALALPDCASIEGPAGTAAPFQNFLNYGNPAQPHDTRGFPYLTETKANNLTREGTYWRWVQRAWMAGLRLMVMSVNENRVLCSLQPVKVTNCDEMDTVRRGLDDIRRLQDYVDAQAGGPGKGFFQIVTDPYAARRVINAGRMAVVLEIEVSEPFGCRGWFTPSCDQAKVDRELDDLYKRGVRSALLLNKFDNPLSGVRFDSGTQGTLINGANLLSAGTFWSAKTCTGPLHDNEISSVPLSSGLTDLLASVGVGTLPLPVYPPAPHCNTRGLTKLGEHTVNALMDKRMIVNPDHMSQAGVDATLSLLERRNYSGVISPHGWMDPGNWPRIWKLGGVAFPGHSQADQYVQEWKHYRPQSTPYKFGWGYGADLGGLSTQPGPGALTYPFKSLDGTVTFDRQKTGQRTFDYATEGVAHYGLYADWFADLKRVGGRPLADDLLQGAEAYLEMWERAEGVPAPKCQGTQRVKLGATWSTVLRKAGQPQQRSDTWAWCTKHDGTDVAVFDTTGKVALAGSTGTGRKAGTVKVGDRMKGSGVRTDGRHAYFVKGGRVRAVATTKLRGAKLRRALRQVRTAKATTARFVPNANANASAGLAGKPLAATGNPTTDAQLALLCNLLST